MLTVNDEDSKMQQCRHPTLVDVIVEFEPQRLQIWTLFEELLQLPVLECDHVMHWDRATPTQYFVCHVIDALSGQRTESCYAFGTTHLSVGHLWKTDLSEH